MIRQQPHLASRIRDRGPRRPRTRAAIEPVPRCASQAGGALALLVIGLAVATSSSLAGPHNPGRAIVPDTYASDWTNAGSWWTAIVDSGFAIGSISLRQQTYARGFIGDSLRSYGVKVVYGLQPWHPEWMGRTITTGEPDSLIWRLASENDSAHFVRRNTGIIAKTGLPDCDSCWVFDFRDTSFARRLAQVIRSYDPKAYGYFGDDAVLSGGLGWVNGLNSEDGVTGSGDADQFWSDWSNGYRHFWDVLNDDKPWSVCTKDDDCASYSTYCSIRPMEGIGPYFQNFWSYQKAYDICRTAQMCGAKGFMFCQDTTHADYRRVIVAIKLLTDAQVCWRNHARVGSFLDKMFPELANFRLGAPVGDAHLVQDPGVYRRDFQRGYVLANVNAWNVGSDYLDGRTYQVVRRGDGLIVEAAPLTGGWDLQAGKASIRAINLVWTVPRSDPTYGAPTAFDLRYRAGGEPITEGDFDSLPRAALIPASAPSAPMCYTVEPLSTCGNYTFAMRSVYASGATSRVGDDAAGSTLCTGTDTLKCDSGSFPVSSDPGRLELGRPSPNPAGSDCTFEIVVPDVALGQPYSLSVHDLAGRRIRALEGGPAEPGRKQVVWNLRDEHGRTVPSGVYFARVRAGDESLGRTVVVQR